MTSHAERVSGSMCLAAVDLSAIAGQCHGSSHSWSFVREQMKLAIHHLRCANGGVLNIYHEQQRKEYSFWLGAQT